VVAHLPERVRELGAGRVGPREHAEVDQLLSHRLVAGDLGQLAVAEQIAAAVADLEQKGAGPHAQVQRERRGHAAVFGVLLAAAEQLAMALPGDGLQHFLS